MGRRARAKRSEAAVDAKPAPPRATSALLALLAALAATATFYLPALDFAFVYDDREQILQNTRIQRADYPRLAFTEDLWRFRTPDPDADKPGGQYYRPIVGLFFWANWRLFGDAPRGWHATSLLLHLVVTLLVARLSRRLGLGPRESAAAALLFGLHPIHAESVAWASGSTDLLMAAFLLASLLLARVGSWPRTAASTACFALAALTKETAYVLPPLFGVLRFVELGRESPLRERLTASARAIVPFGAAAIAVFVARFEVLGFFSKPIEQDPLSRAEALLALPRAILEYVGMIVTSFPAGLGHPIVPPVSWTAAAFWGPLLALAALALGAITLHRLAEAPEPPAPAAFLAAGIVLPLLPVLDLTLLIRDALVQDRYVYVSTAFAVPALVFAARRFPASLRRPSRLAFAFGIVAILAVARLVVLRNTFRDEISLFARASRDAPENAIFRHRHGLALLGANRVDDAIPELERAVALDPDDWVNPINLALAYEREGRYREAADAQLRALEIARRTGELAEEPRFARIFVQAGENLARLGSREEAFEAFRDGAEQDPSFLPAWVGASRAAFDLERFDEAERAARRVVELAPNDPYGPLSLGSALAATGRFDEAEQAFRRAASLAPGRPEPLLALAQTLLHTGRVDEARALVAQVLAANPDHSAARELAKRLPR